MHCTGVIAVLSYAIGVTDSDLLTEQFEETRI